MNDRQVGPVGETMGEPELIVTPEIRAGLLVRADARIGQLEARLAQAEAVVLAAERVVETSGQAAFALAYLREALREAAPERPA